MLWLIFQFVSVFTVELKTTTISDEERSSCVDKIRSNKQVFNLPNNVLNCQRAGIIGDPSVAIVVQNLTTTAAAFDCVTQSYSLINSSTGTKCSKYLMSCQAKKCLQGMHMCRQQRPRSDCRSPV